MLGWYEYVKLPEWKLSRLKAKVDTGARISALHVERIEELDAQRIRFEVALKKEGQAVECVQVIASVHRKAKIRSSTGPAQMRYVVRTMLEIGPVCKPIEVSLASRDTLRFPMLLGRNALARDFWVDPARSCLASRSQRSLRPPHKSFTEIKGS